MMSAYLFRWVSNFSQNSRSPNFLIFLCFSFAFHVHRTRWRRSFPIQGGPSQLLQCMETEADFRGSILARKIAPFSANGSTGHRESFLECILCISGCSKGHSRHSYKVRKQLTSIDHKIFLSMFDDQVNSD